MRVVRALLICCANRPIFGPEICDIGLVGKVDGKYIVKHGTEYLSRVSMVEDKDHLIYRESVGSRCFTAGAGWTTIARRPVHHSWCPRYTITFVSPGVHKIICYRTTSCLDNFYCPFVSPGVHKIVCYRTTSSLDNFYCPFVRPGVHKIVCYRTTSSLDNFYCPFSLFVLSF